MLSEDSLSVLSMNKGLYRNFAIFAYVESKLYL